MSTEDDDLADSPGWQAINDALRPIYGDREPHHVGTIVPFFLGGSDPIHGISAYKNLEPIPHWHFITYGFSELWRKESTNKDVSGFGFELTFRSACNPDETAPPNWALNFLQNLGRYVFETGSGFGEGHTLPLNGPIQQGSDTLIHAATFVLDPQLPPMKTVNGSVEFLQIVGLTMDELEAVSSWNARAFAGLRQKVEPLLITDLNRKSWLGDAAFANRVTEETKREGSSCGWLYLQLECDTTRDPVRVRIQSIAVDGLCRRLLGRIPYGRELVLNGPDATASFRPSEQSRLRLVEGAVSMDLTAEHALELCNSLRPQAGTYAVPGVSKVVIEVAPTEIKDSTGKVVEIVGVAPEVVKPWWKFW